MRKLLEKLVCYQIRACVKAMIFAEKSKSTVIQALIVRIVIALYRMNPLARFIIKPMKQNPKGGYYRDFNKIPRSLDNKVFSSIFIIIMPSNFDDSIPFKKNEA